MNDTERLDALRSALCVLDDSMTCDHIGPHLTCNEANELARALVLAGFDAAAEWLLDGHSLGDEEGDNEDHLRRARALGGAPEPDEEIGKNCADSNCGRPFWTTDPEQRYCDACSEVVYCVRVDGETEEFYHVPDETKNGDEVSAGQCGACGGVSFVANGAVGERPGHVKCDDYELDGESYAGCGTFYTIVRKKAREVIF